MGQGCSCVSSAVEVPTKPTTTLPEDDQHVDSCPDPVVYDLVRRSNPTRTTIGQHHLLYRKGSHNLHNANNNNTNNKSDYIMSSPPALVTEYNCDNDIYDDNEDEDDVPIQSTRLVLRKTKPEATTQIYAIRGSDEQRPEQRPHHRYARKSVNKPSTTVAAAASSSSSSSPDLTIDPYIPSSMMPQPKKPVHDWVCVSEELDIYICDTGLTHAECDQLVHTTEQVCKGHYAAYTYAKQTLGCREFPVLAHACWEPVHRVTHIIWRTFPASQKLQLDDREPHIVKYDVTKKERQKLDMHTDKSEWTFLIALSDGCGLDYEGGGTYFEALDATVHVQRGHALIFPGKLRHCGQRITKGLRFLLVGFLVDKANQASLFKDLPMSSSTPNTTTTSNAHHHSNHHLLSSADITVDT